jgi:hypothetical protein
MNPPSRVGVFFLVPTIVLVLVLVLDAFALQVSVGTF